MHTGPVSTYSIDITDGKFVHNGQEMAATLENVVNLLRARHPEANIVVAPDVPSMEVGALKIRATDLRMELEALRVASGEQFKVSGGGSKESPMYVLEAAPQSKQDQLRVEAFNLGGYFAYLSESKGGEVGEEFIARKVEELQRMVEETVEIYRAIKKSAYGPDVSPRAGLHMQFHRGANLFILIGEPEYIEIAAKVIEALPNVQRSRGFRGSTGFDRYGDAFGGGNPFASPPTGAGSGGLDPLNRRRQ